MAVAFRLLFRIVLLIGVLGGILVGLLILVSLAAEPFPKTSGD